MTPTVLLILALLYVTLLFGVASYSERRDVAGRPTSPLSYALTLGVFCSSWTFYGAVGSMAELAWSHAPIYLGPIALLVLARPVVDRLIAIGHRQRVTSIADFLGARYGKRQTVGGAVAVICLLAVLPYLALQFRALQQIWSVVNTGEVLAPETSSDNVTLLVAVGLALFAILFGARRLDGSERQRGLMQAMAVESLVKLVAFMTVAALSLSYLVFEAGAGWSPPPLTIETFDGDFFAELLIAALAILVLPRQFHVTVVEIESPEQARVASWLFPAYLFAFLVLAVPIAMAGNLLFAGDSQVAADTYVQVLPVALDAGWGVAAAFLGGISAATGMVLVATVAVSIMVTNELITPLLYRISFARSRSLLNLGTLLRRSRQLTVIAVSIAAWLLAAGMSGLPGLSQIGFLSFLGSAQLAPPLLLGLYWYRAHGMAALIGMLAGALLWLVLGVLPMLADPADAMSLGQLTALSLGVNLLLCIALSFVFRLAPADKRQADVFLGNELGPRPLDLSLSPIPVMQLDHLVAPLLSDVGVQRFWRELETTYQQRLLPSDRAPRFVVAAAEAVLANSVGASSAGQIIERLESERQLDLRDLTDLIGTAQRGVFNRESLEAAVENLSHGVSVVDGDLRLVAWNSRYESMFNYPARFLFVGCPIERVYRFNAERGILSTSGRSLEEEVERRLDYMRAGSAHEVERIMPDGRVLHIHGSPMPGGGFVTTYIDITDYREMTQQLEEARQELEARVASGEQTLSERNAMLREENRLRAHAETELRHAYRSKADFMAATSHDLLQPINAARLFAGTLRQQHAAPSSAATWDQLETALARTEQMIAELREMARLDAGKQTIAVTPVSIATVFEAIEAEFAAMAAEKGLALRVMKTTAWVHADAAVLQRLLANLVANAIKYTNHGRVLVGVRQLGNALRVQVCDTGPGIRTEDQARIFREFERLDRGSGPAADGLGLGLSLVNRYAELLGTDVALHSVSGRGSVFSVILPKAQPASSVAVSDSSISDSAKPLSGRIALLDNDPSLLRSLEGLISGFGCRIDAACRIDDIDTRALASGDVDILIVDNHLGDGPTGFEFARQLSIDGIKVLTIVISADDSPSLRDAVRSEGFRFMSKPIEPVRLRALLAALLEEGRH